MHVDQRYLDGRYLQMNPTWDIEDSAWKADQVVTILARNGLTPLTIGDIGCGAGRVLSSLQQKMDPGCTFFGYDISPQAIGMTAGIENERLRFSTADICQEDPPRTFDLLLLLDVIEHIEDYFSLLRCIRPRSEYKILHIPLEIFSLSAMYPQFFVGQMEKSGHLHFFTREIALRMLKELDFQVIDYFYTNPTGLGREYGWKDRMLKAPRKVLYRISEDLAARILGGFSLIVLVR